MPGRIPLIALVACIALAGAAAGQEKPAKPPPDADSPPAAKSDNAKPADPQSSPKPDAAAKPVTDETALRDALKTLARSLQEGKAEGIKQVLYAANATERKMVDAMAAMAVQIAGLHKASVKAFGEEEARALTGDMAAEMSRIDEATVTIDGDTATIRYREPDPPAPADADRDPVPPATKDPPTAPATEEDPAPAEGAAAAEMVLKRVDGRWRVPMSELSKDATPEGIEQRLADLDVQTRVIGELAKEIATGKHRTADKAAEAWNAKMMQALTPGKKPAGEKTPAKGKQEEPENDPSDQPEKPTPEAPAPEAPR